MGLPNMKRNADSLDIDSKPGSGTKVRMTFILPQGPAATSNG